jgi:transposase InsO family protein
MISLACQYCRYGYRRITALLRQEGWRVNHKRVERIWRQEGLKVPQRQPTRRRLWLNDGSSIRLRPLFANHVWSHNFVAERTTDDRPIWMLSVIDEYTRECLAIHIGRQLKGADVLCQLSELFVLRGVPTYLRSDNGSESTAEMVREWLWAAWRQGTVHRTWETGYIKSFNGKLRDELLNSEIFDTILEARVVTEQWRKQCNTIRPHSSLNYRPPAPEAWIYPQMANA